MRKSCLVVIDGWGISPDPDATGDAIRNAETPVMDKLAKEYPSCSIAAHGLSVGLTEELMGNSEVGHLNIGAGRIVFQDIVRIDLAVKKRQLLQNNCYLSLLQRAKEGNGRLHLLGLVSDGGVHAHIKHLEALLQAAKEAQVPQVFIHFFADGRDTAPKSATGYLKQLLEFIKTIQFGSVATITGRYYAMDRDKRWERVEIAYDGMVSGTGDVLPAGGDPVKFIEDVRYANGENDEFLKPIICNKEGMIQDDDTLLFFNFRSDRMRQICQTFGKLDDGEFPFLVKVERKNLGLYSMTQYKADFPFPVLFPKQSMDNVLAEWLAAQDVAQSHIAETEKYAHVTFFFNGGSEAQFKLEDRVLIPSPKVATYDLKPEMSAIEVGQAVAATVKTDKYPFVMCNFAPPDMVGHTGMYGPAIKAVEATDKAIGIIYEACKASSYTLFITSDHGNAEKMLADDKVSPHTAHTTARVPFIMTSIECKFKKLVVPSNAEGETLEETGGALCDVAPTILEFMQLPVPAEMTGKSLLA